MNAYACVYICVFLYIYIYVCVSVCVLKKRQPMNGVTIVIYVNMTLNSLYQIVPYTHSLYPLLWTIKISKNLSWILTMWKRTMWNVKCGNRTHCHRLWPLPAKLFCVKANVLSAYDCVKWISGESHISSMITKYQLGLSMHKQYNLHARVNANNCINQSVN